MKDWMCWLGGCECVLVLPAHAAHIKHKISRICEIGKCEIKNKENNIFWDTRRAYSTSFCCLLLVCVTDLLLIIIYRWFCWYVHCYCYKNFFFFVYMRRWICKQHSYADKKWSFMWQGLSIFVPSYMLCCLQLLNFHYFLILTQTEMWELFMMIVDEKDIQQCCMQFFGFFWFFCDIFLHLGF